MKGQRSWGTVVARVEVNGLWGGRSNLVDLVESEGRYMVYISER